MAKLIQSGEIRRVIKAAIFIQHRAFQINGGASEDNIPFNDQSERFSVADVVNELDVNYSLYEVIATSKLSPMETIIVNGWKDGEIPLPGEKARYGQVKSFCTDSNIPHKDFYIVAKRAMTKLLKKGINIR